MTEDKKRRPRRSKANLIECINNAAEDQIKKRWFFQCAGNRYY